MTKVAVTMVGAISKPYAANRSAFVLDLMEPLRPIIDRKAFELLQSHTFHPADFTIRFDGVCRLNPEMARHGVRLNTDCLLHLTAFPANLDHACL